MKNTLHAADFGGSELVEMKLVKRKPNWKVINNQVLAWGGSDISQEQREKNVMLLEKLEGDR
jgi:hypothetical protein